MKKYIAICIIFFIAHDHALQGMNNFSSHNISHDELIKKIDNEINTYYSKEKFLFSDSLSEKNISDIITIITQQIQGSKIVNSDIIAVTIALKKKNTIFETVINHLIDLGYNDLNNVNCYTLTYIEDLLPLYLTKEIGALPILLRAYIMNCAYNQIACQYTMYLKGYADGISCFDINPTVDLVAISSNNIIDLWDLKKGIIIHTFECLPIKKINFNTTGSQLCAEEHVHNNSYHIYAWNTTSGNCTLQRQYKNIIFGNRRPIKNNFSCTITRDNYCATYSPHDSSQLQITKKNCQPWYLCGQAIKNSHPQSELHFIERSRSYHLSTKYEKQITTKQILDAS